MGLDLRILPAYSKSADFSLDMIELARDSELFGIISILEEKKGREVPRKGINSFCGSINGIEGFGKTTETPYGKVMKSVLAYELRKALSDYKTESWKNKAFIAFLDQLPNDLELWLYWH